MVTAPFAGPEVPGILFAAALLVLTVTPVLLFTGAWVTGISYDEPYHVLRLQHFLDHGWYLLADDLVDGRPGDWVHDAYVYAPVATLLLHGLNLLVGNDTVGAVSFSAEAYAVRHVGVALLSLPAVVAATALGRMVLGSWRWGILSGAVLMAIPLWTGHSMLNMKDVPVASGYSLVTLALALVVVRWRGGLGERLGVAGLLVAGVVLAVGTRPGIWPGVAAAAGLAVVVLWWVAPRQALVRGIDVGLSLVVAWGALVWVYPQGFGNFSWFMDSVFSSANYSGFRSNRLSLLGAVIRDVPLLLLMCGVVGLIVHLRRVPRANWATPGGAVVLLVLTQALLLPGLAAVNGSSLHGLRQLLFAAPAVAVLLTLGIARGYTVVSASTDGQRVRSVHRLAAGVAALALLLPLISQVGLFPYVYSYASVVAARPDWNIGTDQWRTSVRELERSVPEGVFVVCTPVIDDDGTLWRHSIPGGRSVVERSRDCRTDDLSPLRPFRAPEPGIEDEPVADTFAAVVTVPPEIEPVNCEQVDEVTRRRHFAVRFMSRAYLCDLVVPELPGEALVLDGHGLGSEYLLGGWTGSPAQEGVHLIDRRGDLGFAWPGGEPAERFDLVLRGKVDEATPVLANNTQVDVLEPGSTTHLVKVRDLPASVLDDVGLVLTFRAPEGGGVTLRSVEFKTGVAQ